MDGLGPERVLLVFTSRVVWLDVVQGLTEDLSAQLGFDEDDRFSITMAMREGVNNAIVHGNGRDGSAEVEVELLFGDDELEIRIRDQGPGFDYSKVPDPVAPENLMKPTGRGIFLIKHYMDEVDLERVARARGEIRMSKRLPTGTESDGSASSAG